jgi:hypothetical protein
LKVAPLRLGCRLKSYLVCIDAARKPDLVNYNAWRSRSALGTLQLFTNHPAQDLLEKFSPALDVLSKNLDESAAGIG